MGRCEFFRSIKCLSLLVLVIFSSIATAQNIAVKNADSKETLLIDIASGIIAEAEPKAVVYTVKGNLIFAGYSDNKSDILFMLHGTDIFSKKSGRLVLNEKNETVFTFVKGKVWLGSSTANKNFLIGGFEKTNATTLVFRLASSKEILFSTSATLSAAQSMAVLSYFVVTHNIDEQIIEAAKQTATPAALQGSGTMRRLWGNGNEDFIWDGKVLKNRWNHNEYEQWAYDGSNVYRAWFDTGEVYTWDGKTLQSNWNGNAFVHEGNTLRAVFGNTNDEFFIQGNIVKRAWVSLGNDEWEVNGEIPVPIIMMIVFRLAR